MYDGPPESGVALKRSVKSLNPARRVADQMADVSSFGRRGNARMSFGRVDRAVQFCETARKVGARFKDRAIRDRNVIESAYRDLADVQAPEPKGYGQATKA
jgi:hypothetical protein